MAHDANTVRTFRDDYAAEARRMADGPLLRGTEREVYGPAWAWEDRAARRDFCLAEVARLTALLGTL